MRTTLARRTRLPYQWWAFLTWGAYTWEDAAAEGGVCFITAGPRRSPSPRVAKVMRR